MPWPSFLHIIDIMSFAKNAMWLFCSFFLLYYNAAVLAKGEHRASGAEDAHRTDGPINAHVFPSNDAHCCILANAVDILEKYISKCTRG